MSNFFLMIVPLFCLGCILNVQNPLPHPLTVVHVCFVFNYRIIYPGDLQILLSNGCTHILQVIIIDRNQCGDF